MKKIVITEAISDGAVAGLEASFDVCFDADLWKRPDGIEAEISDAHALVVRNQTAVTSRLISLAPTLEFIGRARAGVDNIDVAMASQAGIVVSNAPHQNAVSVAELTIGLVLALARNIAAADRDTKLGGWNRKRYMGIELHGRTCGVVGFGRIGFLTAMRAASFGMKVLAADPFIDPDSILLCQAGAKLVTLDELLEQSDVICCHLPNTPATRGIFDASRFAQMKPGVLFVNMARGDIMIESALIDALKSVRVRAAALDVRDTEPPHRGVLEEMDQVILTPHIGAFTTDAQRRVEAAVCRDVRSVLEGNSAVNPVNFPRPRRRSARSPAGQVAQ